MQHYLEFPHGAMRRKDREITERAEIEEIISSAKIMHLALADRDVPFLVPLHFAFDGQAIYFHSARDGAKIEMLKRNNLVCFEISDHSGVVESRLACDFETVHRTVIGLGRAHFVEDDAEKVRALDLIVAQFTEKKFTYPPNRLDATMVVRIDIDSVKGKKHLWGAPVE
ncbi:MAG: pyridoxamine 5'-phosphate oxidase family protein [Syntrophobacteraceae bacterium]|nr:pyridoxamine 5'-phosphate oxidase family protein [Syntrophobacteraceae bacterium]